MKGFKYTIAMCNYNMADTLRISIDSILRQVDDDFEVLVVDGGSKDGSREILDELDDKHDNFRWIGLEPKERRRLGEERNISVREAEGEYVLLQLDVDDYYEEGIMDFVEVYHLLESELDFKFYLKGDSINMAEKGFLLDIGPYRNLSAGEDKDLWRRLFHRDSIIWLEHQRFWREIKNFKSLRDRVKRDIAVKTSDFQTGISLSSYIQDNLTKSPIKLFYRTGTSVIGYLISKTRQRYTVPANFRKKNKLDQEISKKKANLEELQDRNNINMDYQNLSSRGKEIFTESI